MTILNGFLLRRHYKCRLVFEIRDIWPLTIVEEGGFHRFNPLVLSLAYIEKLGYKYSDVIVGTMPNLGEHVEGMLGYSKKTACIPMGINEETPTILTEFTELYSKKHIPKDKFIIAHVGSVGIANALETFFKSALAMKDNPEIHFLIVGDGDLLPHYKSKYSNLSNLTFAPKVLKSEVQSVLSLCDLVYFSVHVSKVWMFGQSLNKIIDYMLSGKPIIASYSGYPS
ncbi:glycosyltransferase, partial [PVC group bacterium]|nr:glycosyltransferase [PVC group bacterium]